MAPHIKNKEIEKILDAKNQIQRNESSNEFMRALNHGN